MGFVRVLFWIILLAVGAVIGDRYGVPNWLRELPEKALGEVASIVQAENMPEEGAVSPVTPKTGDTQLSEDALECGEASYYADGLAGNPTASGELYDPSKYTAAHKTLDLGTSLTVVRTDTSAAVDVIVNDRGPYAPGRIVDLSRADAEDIALTTDGISTVCIYAN